MIIPAEKLLTCFILFLTLSLAARTNSNPSLIKAKENSSYTTHLEETEVVTILSSTNPSAEAAMEKLEGLKECEVHITHMPTPGDDIGLKRLGVNLTSDANFVSKNL